MYYQCLIKDIWWGIKNFLWNRPNRITCKKLSVFKYHDNDDLFLYSAFQILEDYIEEMLVYQPDYLTKEFECNDTNTPGTREADIKIRELYQWWTIKRPNRPDPWDAFVYPDDVDWFEKTVRNFKDEDGEIVSTYGRVLKDEYKDVYKEHLNRSFEIAKEEHRQYEEDTAKLTELSSIRANIWV